MGRNTENFKGWLGLEPETQCYQFKLVTLQVGLQADRLTCMASDSSSIIHDYQTESQAYCKQGAAQPKLQGCGCGYRLMGKIQRYLSDQGNGNQAGMLSVLDIRQWAMSMQPEV